MSNIIDNLVKMKNLTQMMVALAYSDLFYEDTELNRELEGIHGEIKELEKENLKHVFKIRESDDLRINIIELMEYVKDISAACRNMSYLNRMGKILPFSDKMFSDDETRAILVKISRKSIIIDKTLSESKIRTHTGATVKAVKRNAKWNFNVKNNFVIKSDDIVFAEGTVEAKKIFEKVADGTLRKIY